LTFISVPNIDILVLVTAAHAATLRMTRKLIRAAGFIFCSRAAAALLRFVMLDLGAHC